MALVAAFARDRGLEGTLSEALAPRHELARTPSWMGLERLVRERPALAALVDVDIFVGPRSCEESLLTLRTSFPNLGLILLIRRPDDPVTLFRLGRVGIPNLVLLSVDHLESELARSLARALTGAAPAVVARAVSPYLPRRELQAVYLAVEGIHRRWSAREFAAQVGLSRPFLSERLKAFGLPSAGHLQIWGRLLQAAQWLPEPGRTGESVSRQLEYSSGAAFRRALKSYTGATPTEVVERGGLEFVLRRFAEDCGFERALGSVA